MIQRIGIVGLGRMGANMARRIKDCGYTLSALYDLNPEITSQLASELQAPATPSLAEVTQNSDAILTVISDDKAMKSVFNGGLLKRSRGKLFINCATLSPSVHSWAEDKAENAGAQCLEACMASSIPQAREGSLFLMCAGKPAAFERARPLLEKLSSSLRYIGPAGKAAEVKALVNMVMNMNTAALAEGLGLGQALGLDLTLLREVFSLTGANSRVLQTDGEDMQNRDHSCFFSAEHAAKDSGIALALAKAQNLTLPLAKATWSQYSKMTKAGLGQLDKSGISELTFPNRQPKNS
jgi:3-hydroxyisobutyrate dehydrogenase